MIKTPLLPSAGDARSRASSIGSPAAAHIAALLSLMLLVVGTFAPAWAQTSSASITGRVVAVRGALPIAGATLTASEGGQPVATGTSTNSGTFRIEGLKPGLYDVTVRAAGYDASVASQITVVSGVDTAVNFALTQSTTGSGNMQTIGRVAARSSLASATTISQSISVENLARTGQIRVADQLGTLPGVNFSTSSSVGDDATINLRGFSPDETAILLDGHPVGPLGVGSGGFNIALGPTFGLSSVNITYGSGAQGLYGNDSIGGAVNFLSLAPTATPHETLQQQIGGFGLASTGLTATGTYKRLGYALAAGTFGEYGDFAPGQLTQSARPVNVLSSSVSPNGLCNGQAPDPANPGNFISNNDVSACNSQLNTYDVSQNTSQRVGLAKFTYALGNSTQLQGTAYDSLQFSDSTGNGDNDYLPYSTRLNQVLTGTANCTAPGGGPGFTVTTNPLPVTSPTTACYTAAQLANATYGPDGGGAGRSRGTRMSDYHGSISTKFGINTVTVDGYLNNYVYYKNSSQAGGIDANGNLLGSKTYANYYNTKGFLIDDEINIGPNDLIVGYNVWHQLQTGNESDINGYIPNPTLFFGEWSGFIHDDYTFNRALSAFVNANIKRSSVSQKTTFDPRATLQFRATNNDVFQVTYGRSDGAPSPSLLTSSLPLLATDPGTSLTSVNCFGYNNVVNGGNTSLLPESANDYEAGYGHRFKADSNVQLNAYVTHVTNQIFGASEPLIQYGVNNVVFASGALDRYISRLNSQCGYSLNAQSVIPYLSVNTHYNATSALARGLEITGRERINRIVYLDYSYDIESSARVGVTNNILQTNATVINGAQISGIPLHQASISLGVTPGPWDFRLDTYYVEQNNPYNRPSYYHSNVFLTRAFDRGRALLTLGGTNIFNNSVQDFGYLGLGTVPAQNVFATNPAQANEKYGLAPAQVTLTLELRL